MNLGKHLQKYTMLKINNSYHHLFYFKIQVFIGQGHMHTAIHVTFMAWNFQISDSLIGLFFVYFHLNYA